MNEVAERIAFALFNLSIYPGYDDATKRAEWLRTKRLHLASARTAIEAMRMPNPMGLELWSCPCCGQLADKQAMIDLEKAEKALDDFEENGGISLEELKKELELDQSLQCLGGSHE